MKTKRCSKCGEAKPLEGFWKDKGKNDGLARWCKTCKKAHARASYAAHREEKRQYNRAYYQTHLQEAAAYRASAARRANFVPYYARHKARSYARTKACRAIAAGRLLPRPCRLCGDAKAQAHHHDYSKPLDVNWVCKRCHSFVHRCLRAIAGPLAELEKIA